MNRFRFLSPSMAESGTIYTLLLISFITIFGYGAQRVLVPIYLEEQGTSVMALGIFLSLFGLMRAVMNIVGGVLNDRFSKKYNLLWSIVLFSMVSVVGLAWSESAAMIGVWRMLMAIGLSWGTTSILTLLAFITPPDVRGTVYGIQKVSVWTGIALAGFVAPILLLSIDYSTTMAIFSVIGVIGFVLVCLYVKDSRPPLKEARPEPQQQTAVRPIKKGKEIRSLYLVGFVAKIVEDGVITTFLPLFVLTWAYGQQTNAGIQIGASIALFTLLYAFFQPLGGWLSDKWGKWRLLSVGNSLLFLGLLQWALFLSTWSLLIMVLLTGMGSGIIAATAEARASIVVSNERKGFGLGLWRFFRDMGSFVGPIAVGFMLSVAESIWFLFVVLILIFISLWDSIRIGFFSPYEKPMLPD